jgi:hypothetical protein
VTEARVYRLGGTDVVEARVVELRTGSHIVGQISELPEGQGDGLLIRVWPPDGTHEDGGSNLEALSLVVSFDADGVLTLQNLSLDHDVARLGTRHG